MYMYGYVCVVSVRACVRACDTFVLSNMHTMNEWLCFQVPIAKINQDLTRSVQLTNTLRMIEARDRSILEDNYSRVNFWSSVQLFIMVSVGLVQVLMIRSLFEDRSKVGKILRLATWCVSVSVTWPDEALGWMLAWDAVTLCFPSFIGCF